MPKVLVADDSGTMRKIIVRSLLAVGIEEDDISEASDGLQAIDRFQRGSFNIVLTDLNMPGKNGLEVIRAIRQQDADVTIIMVTTVSEKKSVLEAISAGVSDYLVRPFEAEVLREKLVKHGCPG